MNNVDQGPPTPVSLKSAGDALLIEWSDGATHRLPWSLLREACPCATCNEKRRNPPPPADLPVLSLDEARPVRATAMRPVGNYAYAIHFTDGHTTGIYTLEHLRALGERASAG
ncbi:MAG: DUF971 domain-containing protein [Planctomycetales bacterium]